MLRLKTFKSGQSMVFPKYVHFHTCNAKTDKFEKPKHVSVCETALCRQDYSLNIFSFLAWINPRFIVYSLRELIDQAQ